MQKAALVEVLIDLLEALDIDSELLEEAEDLLGRTQNDGAVTKTLWKCLQHLTTIAKQNKKLVTELSDTTSREAFKNRILEAVKKAQSNGLVVSEGMWGVRWSDGKWVLAFGLNRCCPLGALMLNEQPAAVEPSEISEEYFEKLFKVPGKWVVSFIKGVDNIPFNAAINDLEMYEFGCDVEKGLHVPEEATEAV